MQIMDLQLRAQKLIDTGKMPPLEKVLYAVDNVRQEFGPKMKAARTELPGIEIMKKMNSAQRERSF
jgi:hypothetical protein